MGFLLVAPRLGASLLLSAAALSTACSHAAKLSDSPLDWNQEVPLQIANHNWLDVVIYVLHDGQRTRVGVANASSSASFSLPPRLVGQGREIRLMGHPIGGLGSVTTETVVVQPGQYVEWTLESDLDRSAIGVY